MCGAREGGVSAWRSIYVCVWGGGVKFLAMAVTLAPVERCTAKQEKSVQANKYRLLPNTFFHNVNKDLV